MLRDLLLDVSWRDVLREEFAKGYFLSLESFLQEEYTRQRIYPEREDIFRAYNTTPLSKVKVVIIGQDPYHGVSQAHGLAFSVQHGVALPPSLQNIFKELQEDIGCHMPKSGSLLAWAQQGVFLINAVLSVREGEAGSHQKRGWEHFTDATIQAINEHNENVVFILWGKYAASKESLIDAKRHLVLKAAHPSPLSSYRGFFGSKPFSKSNAYLLACGKEKIDWCLNGL